jgi:hypothetical protein
LITFATGDFKIEGEAADIEPHFRKCFLDHIENFSTAFNHINGAVEGIIESMAIFGGQCSNTDLQIQHFRWYCLWAAIWKAWCRRHVNDSAEGRQPTLRSHRISSLKAAGEGSMLKTILHSPTQFPLETEKCALKIRNSLLRRDVCGRALGAVEDQ